MLHTSILLVEPPPERSQRPCTPPGPRLELLPTGRRGNFIGNLRLLLAEPAPREFIGSPFFRDCWVAGPLPDRAFFGSVVWHAVLVILLVQIWPLLPSPPRVFAPQVEIAYYGPINDLPTILPARPVAKHRAAAEPVKTPSPRGADALNPRQIILKNPLHPNHPRQTLIQPLAPPDPPKFLPSLPNIVELSEPAKPQLRLDPAALARLQPKAHAVRQEQSAAPEVSNQEKLAGAVNIADLNSVAKPAMPILPMSAPSSAPLAMASRAAPELNIAGADQGGAQLIALSETPGPEMPSVVPAGNLSSRVAISPEGNSPGTPGGSSAGEGSGTGPAGLVITGVGAVGARNPATPIAPGTLAARAPSAAATPAAPPRPVVVPLVKPGQRPEALLGSDHVYTLNINMPNLTSASGSWTLSFAELEGEDRMAVAHSPVGAPADPKLAPLNGPEALRKVDPRYPPELRGRRIEGEVVLYAVIRKDGSVDSIQLLQGLDPTLDQNAMQALAQWKFRPGERQGVPVELQAIVHIPFHVVTSY